MDATDDSLKSATSYIVDLVNATLYDSEIMACYVSSTIGYMFAKDHATNNNYYFYAELNNLKLTRYKLHSTFTNF